MGKGANADIDKLANALAVALVGALDGGSKEATDSGGWESILNKGPQAFIRGQKAPTGVPDNVNVHGPGGLFATAGIENMVINLHMTPVDLDPMLKVFPTVYMNPLYPFLTGFSEDSGSEPNGKCEDCLGGTMQGGLLTAQFGHICRGSDEIHIMRTLQMINRGETTPLQLLGDVLGPNGISKMPNTPGEWLEVVTKAEMVKIGILLQRKIMKMTWNGNPARNTLGGGYMEFPGLEMLVGTGKMDAITGAAMGSADSLVMDFNFNDIGAVINGNDIVTYISTMEWYVRHNAERMGFLPVQWVFCVNAQLWQELTAIWPCRYNTNRCSTGLGENVNVNLIGSEMTALRDRMREQMTIQVNGRTYPVVICDGMTELHGNPALPGFNANVPNGMYASSIFFLPLTVRGGISTLYWEHQDYSKADPEIALTRSQNDFWTDSGRWFWTVERLRGCYKMNAEIDLRIILRTPHLAARLDNVRYSPMLHLRSPFALLDQTHADPYFVKGGRSTTELPNYYSEWNQRQLV